MYVIDISGMEGRDPREDFRVLQNELKEYRPDLLEKPFLVALNKIDTEDAAEHAQLFREEYPYAPDTLFEISAMSGIGVDPLLEAMRRLAQLQVIRYS